MLQAKQKDKEPGSAHDVHYGLLNTVRKGCDNVGDGSVVPHGLQEHAAEYPGAQCQSSEYNHANAEADPPAAADRVAIEPVPTKIPPPQVPIAT